MGTNETYEANGPVRSTSQNGYGPHATLRRMKRTGLGILLFMCAFSARAADKLTIVKAGPIGEVANLAEANEIRVVFSEPMYANSTGSRLAYSNSTPHGSPRGARRITRIC